MDTAVIEQFNSIPAITTETNQVLRPIHDRMPVILPSKHHESWLAPNEDARQLLPLRRPFAVEKMEAVAMNPFVNNSRNEGPTCLDPVA